MKTTLLLLLSIAFISCNTQNRENAAINEKDEQQVLTEISIEEPTETSEGKIQGDFGGCGYNYTPNKEAVTLYKPRLREINQINSILKFSGLSSNFKIYSANIDNAVGTIVNGKRYILYDPNLLAHTDQNSGSYWSSMSILAHEIGHHLAGHTITNKGSNPPDELEADKYSGFVLYKLGASQKQAIAAILALGSETASLTHPAKADRVKAIEKGWNEANQQRFDSAIPPPPIDNPTVYYTYTYDMLLDEENIREGQRSASDYANYDYFYGIIRDVEVENNEIKKLKVFVKRTGPEWETTIGSLDGETIDVFLDDYWKAPELCMACKRALPSLLVPGRRLKFSFVEGMYGGTAEAGYLILTYAKAVEGSAF